MGIHTDFLAELNKAVKGAGIPDCFVKYKEKFLIYGDFCSNLPHSQEKVDELCTKSEAVREKINVSHLTELVCEIGEGGF